MAFNFYVVKELLENGFPVISIGFCYNNYQNHKVVLKDIIHDVVLEEEITGNFETDTIVSITPVYRRVERRYPHSFPDARYTYVVRDYINRRFSDIRHYHRIYAGNVFTLLGPAEAYFVLETVTRGNQTYWEYEDINYYDYACSYPAPGYNEHPTIIHLYACCEGIAYGERKFCFSGIDFGSIYRLSMNVTDVSVSSRLFIDMLGRVILKKPLKDIMRIRSALYFFTFFNFYQVEHAIHRFIGLPIAIPPPFWLIPIGELGFIRYRLNDKGKITYDFLPLTYFYYGIFTFKFNLVYYTVSYVFNRHGYARGNIGTLYIQGTGCSIPAKDYWEYSYHGFDTGKRDIEVIPQIDKPQNLYVFKEKYTTRVEQYTGTKIGTYHRYLTELTSSCVLRKHEIFEPINYSRTVTEFGPQYYWQRFIPPAYLYRPALVFLTKANRLLYINPRT